jgi:hypothetical protein
MIFLSLTVLLLWDAPSMMAGSGMVARAPEIVDKGKYSS